MLMLNKKNDLHIWQCDYSQFDNAFLLNNWHHLSYDEQTYANKYLPQNNRKCYLFTRILIRLILSEYEPVRPSDWLFRRTKYKRLKVYNRFSKNPRLSFNISHSNTMIVVALTTNNTIGIDVESYNLGKDYSLILESTFSMMERARSLSNITEKNFIEHWTLKEAFCKAIGKGLNVPLTLPQFFFKNSAEIKFLIPENPFVNHRIPWLFWLFDLKDNYIMSLCTHARKDAINLHFKQILPPFNIQTLQIEPYRVSQR